MPRVEFVGQTARDAQFPTGGTSRLINGYREPMVPGGRAPHVLRAVPGMQQFAELSVIFARAATTWNDKLAVIAGDRLWTIDAAGVVINAGDVDATDDIASLDQSTGKLIVAAGRKYWTWDGTTLANPATGAVTSVAGVTYLGGYAIVSQFGGRVFAWSALADPATWPGLSFASAEITAEPIIRAIAFKDALYLFKASGYERWGVTGAAGASAFARIEGAQGEPGLLDFNLITTFPNGMAWVGSDGKVHVLGMGPISTPPLEVALAVETPRKMFFYEQRGHGFICLTFSDRPAWCYDIATGEWHEREQDGGAWEAGATAKLAGSWYAVTDSGKVAKLSGSCTDFGSPMVRRFVSNTLEMDERFIVDLIEAFPRPAGDVQGDGTPAKLTLKMSRDGGMTWGAGKDREVGTAGAWEQRLTWRALGQFRKATAELSLSCAADVPILSTLEVQAG